jgi:N-acetylmuramoyl-L-alanine amidase
VKTSAANRLLAALVCVAAVASGGCIEARPNIGVRQKISVVPSGTIAVSQMARRLGLAVQRVSAHNATLVNQFNSVVLFADPAGVAYVNGSQVGQKGGLATVDDTLYVPQLLEQDIRLAMRTGSYFASTPRPVPPVKRPSPSSSKPRLIHGPVLIDAGHGGKDPGAGHNGCREKDIVLDVALMMADMLRASGVDARLTRSTDTFVELNDRAAMARDVGAKLFVSLHCDAAANRRARGFTIYAPENRMGQTSGLATAMEKSMLTTRQTSRGIRAAGYRVLLRTSCPAILLEMGYLTNRYDARLLAAKSHQRIIARAASDAITAYLTR